jgi:hypothetical protein
VTRRRAVLGGAAAAALVVVLLLVVLVRGGGDDGDGAVAEYAATWQDACAALRDDAARTAASIRTRTAAASGRSPEALQAAAAAVAGPYLDRTAGHLRDVAAARPPQEWRRYHDGVAPTLRAAQARATATAVRVRRGDVAALSALDLGSLTGAAASAPADLRRRTPACTAGGA